MALAAYRHILRSARIAFGGDIPTLTAARKAARDQFNDKRSLTSQEEIDNAVQHARDVGTILQQNVVQGKYDEKKERYKLNIHEHTERGDNDTIKAPPPNVTGKRNTLKNAKVGRL